MAARILGALALLALCVGPAWAETLGQLLKARGAPPLHGLQACGVLDRDGRARRCPRVRHGVGQYDGLERRRALGALTGHNACGLTHDGEGKLNSLAAAAWTPDGRRLLYRAGSCKFDCRVCVIDVTEGRVYPLSSERPAIAFSLSRDGRSVAYSSTRGIFVTDLEGGTARALVPDGWGPAWSRDGRRIAFLVSAGPDVYARHYHIETTDPAGGNRQRLTAQAGHYGLLTWSP